MRLKVFSNLNDSMNLSQIHTYFSSLLGFDQGLKPGTLHKTWLRPKQLQISK